MSKFFIERSININAPASKVWRAFTHPALTGQMGGEYVSGWKGLDGDMLTNGTIMKLEPEKLLQHTLLDSVGSTGSVITYEFGEKNGVTTVHAWEDFTNPIIDKDYQDAAEGCDTALRALKDTAEKENR